MISRRVKTAFGYSVIAICGVCIIVFIVIAKSRMRKGVESVSENEFFSITGVPIRIYSAERMDHITGKIAISAFRDIGLYDRIKIRDAINALSLSSDELFRTIPFGLDRVGKMAVLVNCLVHNLAPYGPNGSGPVMTWKYLNCDDYAGVLYQYLQLLLIDDAEDVEFFILGFSGGYIYDHAQVVLSTRGQTLLLDPTYGIAALITQDELLDGRPVSPDRLATFYSYWYAEGQSGLRRDYLRVVESLRYGFYRRDWLWYMYKNDKKTLYKPF